MYDDDEPAVVLSGGPVWQRQAEHDDPPYAPPRIRLGFAPPGTSGLVEVRRLCDVEPSYVPGAPAVQPLLWDGDQA